MNEKILKIEKGEFEISHYRFSGYSSKSLLTGFRIITSDREIFVGMELDQQ